MSETEKSGVSGKYGFRVPPRDDEAARMLGYEVYYIGRFRFVEEPLKIGYNELQFIRSWITNETVEDNQESRS